MQPQRPRCSPGASDAALEAQMQLWRFRCVALEAQGPETFHKQKFSTTSAYKY